MQELDRIQARGQMGAKSPLLWDDGQVEDYLAGSPLVAEIKERLEVSLSPSAKVPRSLQTREHQSGCIAMRRKRECRMQPSFVHMCRVSRRSTQSWTLSGSWQAVYLDLIPTMFRQRPFL